MINGFQYIKVAFYGIVMSLIISLPLKAAIAEKMDLTPHAFNWVFSGMVLNERGERYGYYFEVRRHESKFQVLSALIDVEKKSVIFVDENEAMLSDVLTTNWQIGRSYLGFNPVTNRWSLGVQTADNRGFNFKIDSILHANALSSNTKTLRTGLAMSVDHMGRLNGHLHVGGEEEEFVTAKSTWLRQFMSKDQADSSHPLTNVLCHFNDGSGFYAVHLLEPDALQSFVAGWHSPTGLPVKMSQFVSIHHPSIKEWDLSSSLPSFHIHFSNLLDKSFQVGNLGAGVVDGKLPGFCTAAKETV